ncbi:MAG TPA: hypothetical protein DCK95_06115 [Anaerolineaceae bacterium]|nr:hypothetical protein [Anaerolineaceae bacterium]
MENGDLFKVHMPEVDIRGGLDKIFSQAKQLAEEETILADGSHLRHVVIISPGRLLLIKDSYPPDTLPSENRTVLEELIPSHRSLKIAVITYTFLDALRLDVRKAIPFFDYLLGFTCIGHAVWIFEGHSSVLEMGCHGADFVLIDQRMLPFLEPDWEKRIKGIASVQQVRIITIAE